MTGHLAVIDKWGPALSARVGDEPLIRVVPSSALT